MNSDRRSFLKQVGGAAATVVAATALSERGVAPAAAQDVLIGGARPSKRGYVTRNCLLELEGQVCGWLWFAEGGCPTADVLEDRAAKGGLRKKQLGPLKYEDLTLTFGAGLSQVFYDWVKSLFARQPQRKNGAIVYLDATGREVSRLAFTNALVIEAGFPMLDAAWTEAALMTVKVRPESTCRHRDHAGRPFNLEAGGAPAWLASNFRLNIAGLSDTTSRVMRVEPLTVNGLELPGLAVSDLILTYPASAGLPLETWFEDFVLKGNNADPQEKAGTLEFLAPDLQTAFFTLSFEHLGVFRLEPVLLDAGDRLVHLLQARLYCENVRFDHYLAQA